MQREVPGVLWVGLVFLGLISIVQLVLGILHTHAVLLVGVALNLLLLWGLYHGHRWAFVVTVVLGSLGIVLALARGPIAGLGVLVGNGLVLVPVILARDYFWAPRPPTAAHMPNYCCRCGHKLEGVVQTHCPNCGVEIRLPG